MEVQIFLDPFSNTEQLSGIAFFGVILLGLIVGSFLNVVIHRLPIMMEREWEKEAKSFLDWHDHSGQHENSNQSVPYHLAWPPSHCPHCFRKIKIREIIPVVSWLWLRARCPGCNQRISWQYPLVEILTSILFVWLLYEMGLGLEMLAGWVLTAFLLVASGIDARTSLLPDQITLPLLWFGLFLNTFDLFTPLHSAVLGAIAGYLFLWLVFHGFRLLTGKEGMGYGDFKLLAALGAWLGWSMLPVILLLSATVAVIVGLFRILIYRMHKDQPIPFGPYLAAAGWFSFLFAQPISDFSGF